MSDPHFPPHPVCAFLLLPLIGLLSPLAFAEEWKGTTRTVDGVEQVMNPADPLEEPVTLVLEESWRLGGDSDSDDEFFGVITQVASDADGNVYLLDQQLNEVKVFSSEGDFLRTLGREGEGPGEFRQPQDMFFLDDGTLVVLQLAPGRLVLLNPDGEPAGEIPIPTIDGGTPALVGGQGMGDGVMLVVSANTQHEGRVDIERSMVLVDGEGNVRETMLSEVRELEFVNFTFHETAWRSFDNRWRVGSDGNLYAAPEFDAYRIAVWNPDGSAKRVISREFTPRQRTAEQKQEMYDVLDALLQNQLPTYKIDVSGTDPDINQVYPRDDGTLWVLNSRGAHDAPDGALGTFDVFDPDGRFVRQVTLMGEGEAFVDGYFFDKDRVFVVTDLLEANMASRGGRKGGEVEDEPEPISVICYRLELGTMGS